MSLLQVALFLLVWTVVAALLGMLVGRLLRRGTSAPPARPSARLVRTRGRAGVVEMQPTSGDAENGCKRDER